MIDTGYTDTALPLFCTSLPSTSGGRGLAYNGVHPYMAEGKSTVWARWIAALDKLELLKPRAVIAGPKRPENDDHPRIMRKRATSGTSAPHEETTTVREFSIE